ncbi:uncharacterized protein CC84DRAFT_1209964 [Paraphaeosphaeria sporulosa]|uniref:Uncharacterized protein n=1 Tax=Paraphaeosphaeria sporulosa TaxID=1460663 RepID=A0A177BW49_9PLEO|nr:uncharacterized protein CC84DRAFT_1209964 [Paraphaeosphaeria sporulosa]OAF99642.1 hypothetical protein CC84DRAFT_1209964 [Paraphaeosphaeria sporulosa]
MHDLSAVIHTKHLDHILDINTSSGFAMVGPNVAMKKLVRTYIETWHDTGSGTVFPRYDKSLGAIGISKALRIMLMPALKWVELNCIPVRDAGAAMETLGQLAQDPKKGVLEALIYGPEAQPYVATAVGKLTTASNHSQAIFSTPDKEWFYEHSHHASESTESTPVTDTTSSVHDLIVPQDPTSDMLEYRYLGSNLKIHPLPLSPVRQWPENRASTFGETHRQTEQSLHRLGGFKRLYSRNYYAEEEFWQKYPKEEYDQLRVKYHAELPLWKKSEAPARKTGLPKQKSFWDRLFARTGVVAMNHAQGYV